MSGLKLTSVSVAGFRNLAPVRVEPGEAVTFLHGPNGAGKTNFLDAVHFALQGRSLRGGYARDSIGFDSDTMRLEAIIDAEGDEHRVVCAVTRSGERLRELDGQPLTGPDRRLRLEVFHPDLLALVKGPPSQRRSYTDELTANLRPSEADLRPRYGRTLAQRNALARRVAAGSAPISDLGAWDDRLASLAADLVGSRSATVGELAAAFPAVASSLGLEDASIEYRPKTGSDLSESEISTRLADLRSGGDVGRSYLQYGPHMDEIEVRASGRPVRRFASQGQQRTAVLALLLSERALLVTAGRPAPLLLLDDVMSELDPERRAALAAALAGGQAILTATESSQLPLAALGAGVSLMRVDDGVIDQGHGEASAAA